MSYVLGRGKVFAGKQKKIRMERETFYFLYKTAEVLEKKKINKKLIKTG